MAARVIAFICIQFAVFSSLDAQCLNRVFPGLGQNILPVPVAETIIPNQVLLSNYPGAIDYPCQPYVVDTFVSNLLPNTILPNTFVPNNLVPNTLVPNTLVPNTLVPNTLVPNTLVPNTIVPNQVVPAATTIIQDSTVANNLANALQLLVVSNLLSNTLPLGNDVIVPGYAAGYDYGVIGSPVGSPCGYGQYNYIY